MDGSPRTITLPLDQHGIWSDPAGQSAAQRTLKAAIGCTGVGLHTGRKVQLTLQPALAGTGIVFRRTDVPSETGWIDIPARYDLVEDARLCTMLVHPVRPDVRVGTVEHVLAALSGCSVHNAIIELDGPEVPILDGSSECFAFLIECAGIRDLPDPVAAVEIVRPVRVSQGDAFAEFLPGGPGLDITMSIDFDAPAIGAQTLSVTLSPQTFRGAIARARTFTLASEVAALRGAGLGLGGSLANAVVVDNDRVLNPEGLRMKDEFVRHKLLDAIGDLSLAGTVLHGRFVGHKSGHALNNRLLRTLFADDANWAPLAANVGVSVGPFAGWGERDLQVASASL